MNKKIILIISILFVITSSSAIGSTFSINATGFPNPSGVESILIELSISPDFSLSSTTKGDAVPVTPLLSFPWVTGIPTISSGLLKIDWYNGDIADTVATLPFFDGIYSQNNMLNGTIATLTFTAGAILGVSSFVFSDLDGIAVSYTNLISSNFQTDGVTFNAVPIPAAVWLLGSGVVGLLALKRRRKA